MTIEDQISDLLEKATPLRHLDDDDPRKARLAAIVDEINALRAEQSRLMRDVSEHEAQDVMDSVSAPKRGPGRPRKEPVSS